MANLVKEKNFLIFTNNKGNVYRFDISSGIMYSTKGKPMASQPDGLVSYMRNHNDQSMLVYFMYYQHEWHNTKYNDFSKLLKGLSLCDRLDSIGYNRRESLSISEIEYLDKYFKHFAKALKENNELRTREFITAMQKQVFFDELNIKIDDYYTEEILNLVYYFYRNFAENKYDIKTYRLMAYYLSRGVYTFLKDSPIAYYDSSKRDMFEEYFEMCKVIGYEPTKDDFFKQYIMVKKTYWANKKQYDSEKIQKHYELHSNIWDFETDDLFIYVPTCSDDFAEEGKQQNNCVYTMYLDKVLRGETNVLFIRKKSEPNKSYITCEVTNSGYINQYYYKGNSYVPTDHKAENDFRLGFIKYLEENWK